METRTSHKWSKSADRLNLQFLDFNEDYPNIGEKFFLPPLDTVNCNDYKAFSENSLISTFVDDYILERYWNNPVKYSKIMKKAGVGYAMSPDFTVLVGMPEPIIAYQIYKNRLVGYVWKKKGIKIIPTISWGDKKSFAYSIKGITFGSIIAVSNIGCRNEEQKRFFDAGYNYVMEHIQPEKVIFMSNNKYRASYESDKTIFIQSHFEKKRKQWEAEADKL
jgi:hypothetical protein